MFAEVRSNIEEKLSQAGNMFCSKIIFTYLFFEVRDMQQEKNWVLLAIYSFIFSIY
jgi:hypothetical protein